jgi:hypothetical protein
MTNAASKVSLFPVSFMFQPTEYEVVPSDRLQEWEQDLQAKVGLLPGIRPAGAGTWSGCRTFDDCDYIPS